MPGEKSCRDSGGAENRGAGSRVNPVSCDESTTMFDTCLRKAFGPQSGRFLFGVVTRNYLALQRYSLHAPGKVRPGESPATPFLLQDAGGKDVDVTFWRTSVSRGSGSMAVSPGYHTGASDANGIVRAGIT